MTVELKPGVVLNDTYRLLEPIGKGGMGEVWKAQHQRLPKKVAVKILLETTLANETSLARFRREAEIASSLEHPNIVEVVDFNTLPGGIPYMVLELLKGDSLRARIQKRGPMPLDEVLKILKQVASGLAEAHRNGVVHRDLKPENIHLVPEFSSSGPTERAKVLDFGISKLQGGETALTQESEVLGTPVYMAPEQVSARHGDIDGRTDQFALGTICYEMLTGSVAFGGHSVIQVLGKILEGEPQPLTDFVPGVPPHVSEAIHRAISKKVGDRFSSVTEFVEALEGGAPAGIDPGLLKTEQGLGAPASTSAKQAVHTGPNVGSPTAAPPAESGGDSAEVAMAATMASGPVPNIHASGSGEAPPGGATASQDIGTQSTLYASSDQVAEQEAAGTPASDEPGSPGGDAADDTADQKAGRREIPPTSAMDPVADAPAAGGAKGLQKLLIGGLVLAAMVIAVLLVWMFRGSDDSGKASETDDPSALARSTNTSSGKVNSPHGSDPKTNENSLSGARGKNGGDLRHGKVRAGSDGMTARGDDPGSQSRQGSSRDARGQDPPRDRARDRDARDSRDSRGSRGSRGSDRHRGRGGREGRTRGSSLPPKIQKLLDQAKAALRSGNYSRAVRYARRSLAHRTSTAFYIMVKARCAQKDLMRARAALRQLSGSKRRRAVSWCRRKGMNLAN